MTRYRMANEIPDILISAPLYDSDDDEKIPSIIVTRDSTEEDFSSTSPQPPVPDHLYPASLYPAVTSEDPADSENVEDFIQSRLEMLGLVTRPTVQRREEREGVLVSALQEVLECPVCREGVRGEVYQCHEGHVMCRACRARLWSCPVCRAALSRPPIRNRALERLARLI